MGGDRRDSTEVIATKLDILIGDFQTFKKEQTMRNKEMEKFITNQTSITSILTNTAYWHSVIGSFLVGVSMALIYKDFF